MFDPTSVALDRGKVACLCAFDSLDGCVLEAEVFFGGSHLES